MPYGQITLPNTTLAHLHTNAVGAGGALKAGVTLIIDINGNLISTVTE